MIEEKNVEVIHEAAAPRWIGIAVVIAGNRFAGGSRSGLDSVERDRTTLQQSLAAQTQQTKQNDDMLNQRLAKAEDTNAQLQGELSVVTDKMKLTQTELSRARSQTKKIKEEDAQGTRRPAEQRQRPAGDEGQRR